MSSVRMSIACRLAALVVLASFAGAAPAAPSEEGAKVRRDHALENLRSADAGVRGTACDVLGETGGDAELPMLLSALRDSSPQVRQRAEQAIWRIWSRSGDAETDRLFGIGLSQMQAGELRAAVGTFGRVIERRPEFAEGWNKRATVLFLLGDLENSLRDCDEVIRRNPVHFGVLAGYGQIHAQRGDLTEALDYFERALEINPNMEGVRASVEAIGRAISEQRRRFI